MTEPHLVRAAYDAIAADYADHFADELAERPIDRAFLTAFAELVRRDAAPAAGPAAERGPLVADVGCGPGLRTAFLQDLGLTMIGIDLSPEMVAVARQRHPRPRFEVGSMLDLPLPTSSVHGLAAMYSLIHVADEFLPTAVAEFARVLAPGGHTLVVFQTDAETLHLAEAFGKPLGLDYLRHPVDRIAGLLKTNGITVHTRMLREPDETMTAPHAFLLARKQA
ncbi:class I SAM-dependent methyltransferase [Cryptosporangium aurantiacum]|uniref:class I SAM-dependent methyltransferase n=1 Tax=Cryptosporangium aurantiacum TaxID=134849 RepID=UPI00093301FA|nr:class I SAM-dependent methyltransferase [Cryptosporangium aurantiacum]